MQAVDVCTRRNAVRDCPMPESIPTALFVLTQVVGDWAGEGPAFIHWAARRREPWPAPWPLASILIGVEELSPDVREAGKRACQRCFTLAEANDLCALLVHQPFSGKQSPQVGRINLPANVEVVLAMQDANPYGTLKLWRIRPLDPVLGGHLVPCEGIVSLLPRQDLLHAEPGRLTTVHESLPDGHYHTGQAVDANR